MFIVIKFYCNTILRKIIERYRINILIILSCFTMQYILQCLDSILVNNQNINQLHTKVEESKDSLITKQ